MPALKATSAVCRIVSIVCVMVCVCCLAPPARGAPPKSPFEEGLNAKTLVGPAQAEWSITADQLSYDEENGKYLAEGHVRIKSVDRIIEADWAELDSDSHKAELRGSVWLVLGRDWIKGEHVFWDLEGQTGWVDGGLAYFAQTNFYIQGARIAKTGTAEYELREGYVTSCDPNDSDWKIRYDDLKVKVGGAAWARGTSFQVRDVPVLYSPILGFPVQTNRQSGFLLPWAGGSTLNGVEFEVPYYWAIRKDMDATFFGHYMEKRGFMGGVEYRISNQTFGDGVWLFNYLHDDSDQQFLAEKGYPLETRNRYWLRARQNFELPWDITGRLDLDMASDRNFLNEFTKGSASYDYSNRLFRDLTGRGILNDKGILSRESSLYLEQRHESSLLSLDTRYWDQLNTTLNPITQETPQETTLQRLPAFSYSIIPSWIGGMPLYYTLQSSAVNYWVLKGDSGGRLDVSPRLYWPLHWGNYLDMEPSVGLRSTSYAVDWRDDPRDTLQGRFVSEVRMDMSSRVNRVYPIEYGNNVAVQHAFRPEFAYEYVPDPIQGKLPFFDRLDRNPARHDVRYGFSTFATSKRIFKDSEGDTSVDYIEFARLGVTQAYHIERLQEQDPSSLSLYSRPEEGFSDVSMRLDLTPLRYLTLSYETEVSPESGSPSGQDVFLTLTNKRGDSFRLDYQYRTGTVIDEIIGQLNIQVLPNIYITTYHDYSFNQSSLFAQGYGLRYQRGCWAINLLFEKEDKDTRIGFALNLLGIGNIGSDYNFGGGVLGSLARSR